MRAPRITLTIGEIVTDQPGLSRRALVQALEQAISTHIAEHDTAGLGPSLSRASAQGNVESGKTGLSQRVASATLKAMQP